MALDQPDIDSEDARDPQDVAEVFDEDNLDSDSLRLANDDEELNFDTLPSVYDATRADGDEDEDEAIIGDDLDDDQIVALSSQEDDEGVDEDDDDAFRSSENFEDDDEDASDEVELSFAGDLNEAPGARSAAQRYESRSLSDADLSELGYQAAPKETKSFSRNGPGGDGGTEPGAQVKADREDKRLDVGLEDTFPASDPVSVKHIT